MSRAIREGLYTPSKADLENHEKIINEGLK